MSCFVVPVLPYITLDFIFLLVEAVVVLLGLEVDGQAMDFVLALSWGVHFPLWSDIAGLGLVDMRCCFGEMTLACCFVGLARVSVFVPCSCFAVPYIWCYFFSVFVVAIVVLLGQEVAGHALDLALVLF